MLTYSIRDIIEHTTELVRGEHYLYVVQDEEGLPLYVGQSLDPVRRLLAHMGISGNATSSHLGQLIREHWPLSFSWTVTLLTLQDCEHYVDRHFASLLTRSNALERYFDPRFLKSAISLAEQALIAELRPCLNVEGHARPLPEKYQGDALAP
jgi:hypothetical protein